MTMAAGQKAANMERLQVQEFGALWLANQIEKRIELAKIIDEIIPSRTAGPSMGEYFLYAAFNRMVDATSKRALPEWFSESAVQSIRQVDTNALDSEGYHRKWSKVSDENVQKIAKSLFKKTAALCPSTKGCFVFDTTNIFTFMASDTESELAKRGKNKQGRDWLRQIGLALLVDRHSRLPIHYREYSGNCHDSKVFATLLEELISTMRETGGKEITLVIDKGMNSQENFQLIDEKEEVHFITSYSPYFVEEFVLIGQERFVPVETPRNKRLKAKDRHDDCLLAFRTSGEYWGRERAVVVTYNPLTASKQRYLFDKKLQKLQIALYEIRAKVRQGERNWKQEDAVRERYAKLCEEMHLPATLYDLNFERNNAQLSMSFRKNHYRISRHIEKFGKNVLITDQTGWSTDAIVQAALDRYVVEDAFRQSKNDDLVAMAPIRHWTDQTIRCHFLSCMIALTYLRTLELILREAGIHITAERCMHIMRSLHSCLYWTGKNGKPQRMIEDPTPEQAAILHAFGHTVAKGVLQKITK